MDKILETFEKKLNSAQSTREGGVEVKVDTKKLFDLVHNIKRLFDELRKVPEIEEKAKFIEISLAVNNLFEKHKNNH